VPCCQSDAGHFCTVSKSANLAKGTTSVSRLLRQTGVGCEMLNHSIKSCWAPLGAVECVELNFEERGSRMSWNTCWNVLGCKLQARFRALQVAGSLPGIASCRLASGRCSRAGHESQPLYRNMCSGYDATSCRL
jgi:hypothetical protein